ncbi:MAG: Hpt domain-containing protein [Cyclobacteriaceae bacterium]|nr:Hpt domain-containing protein [Cyclobacteriaceae bacterium]
MKHRLTDLTYLNSISEDDQEFKKDIINTFLQNTPLYLADMKSGLDTLDWKKIGDIAHSLKPSFTLMGMTEKKDILLKIEAYGRNRSHTGKLSGLIRELETVIQQAISELREDLDGIA